MPKLESSIINFSENVEETETIDQKPFVIRGHHLFHFINLLRETPYLKQSDPAEQAKIVREECEKYLAMQQQIKPERQDWVDEEALYSQDVIGLSLNDAEIFENNNRAVLERFLSLPEDYPATIVKGIPDSICNTCIIGEHCRKFNPSGLRGDGKYLGKFMQALQALRLPQPIIAYEKAYFSDVEPRKVRILKTTMGVIRKVLKESNPRLWEIN